MAALDDLAIELESLGLEDLNVLVINEVGDEDSTSDVEDYALPVLQDTEADDVFGAWNATSYDVFIIDREGQIAFAQTRLFPVEDHDLLVEELTALQ